MKVIQVNLRHKKAASSALVQNFLRMNARVALIQEPWVNQGKVCGLNIPGCEIFYDHTSERPRTCIVLRKSCQALAVSEFCTQDCTAVKIKITLGKSAREVLLASVYMPGEEKEPPCQMVEKMTKECGSSGTQIIIGCDANAHHEAWKDKKTDPRGELILEFILTNNLILLNEGSVPTYKSGESETIIDLTMASGGISKFIRTWRVSLEPSLSDHRYLIFRIENLAIKPNTYRNPRRLNGDSFRSDLEAYIEGFGLGINRWQELEETASRLEEEIIISYERSCPLTNCKAEKDAPWWNSKLSTLRKNTRKLFNRAKKTGKWDTYKESLNDYNKAIKESKNESWRRYCSEIEKVTDSAKLSKMLSKGEPFVASSLRKADGKFTKTGKETLELLAKTNFPGSKIVEGTEDQIKGKVRTRREIRAAWHRSRMVVTVEKVKWAISTFEPYKSPGVDGVYPVLLQTGGNALAEVLCRLYRASIALGHIPTRWKESRVVFIPKAGKAKDSAKGYRPICLSSFLLKTLEKLVDRHLREVLLEGGGLHGSQYAYQPGKSTETALLSVVSRIEKALQFKEIALGAFLDIEGAFDNTNPSKVVEAMREKGVDEPLCHWIHETLVGRKIRAEKFGEEVRIETSLGCPQGGVLSPLLWNLTVDSLLRTLNDKRLYTIGFADDVCTIICGKDLSTVTELMGRALRTVENWCVDKGLKVNPSKAHLVVFTKKYKRGSFQAPKIFGKELQVIDQVKFLGVYLDKRLTWNAHLNYVTNKAKRNIMTLRRLMGKNWGLRPEMMHWMYCSVIRPSITYASAVWGAKTDQKTARSKLGSVQRLALLCITGAMRTTPTAALEAILGIPPLHIEMESKTLEALYRLTVTQGFNTVYWAGTKTLKRLVELPGIEMAQDRICPKYHFEKNYHVTIPARVEWNWEAISQKLNLRPQDLIWFTDGSKTNAGSGAGIFCRKPGTRASYSLGKYCTVFQAEVFAIDKCAERMITRDVKHRHIVILSDSQAALRALDSWKITSKLVFGCMEKLVTLGKNNRINLVWIPGHSGHTGNEIADKLAVKGSAGRPIGPEPCCGLPKCVIKQSIRELARRWHLDYWTELPGLVTSKANIKQPERQVKKVLKANRSLLRKKVSLLTGHGPFRKHLQNMGLFNGAPLCRLCGMEEETSMHIIDQCEALARRRYDIFGVEELSTEENYENMGSKALALVKGLNILALP